MMMVLSGMSSMEQMVENISFMKDFRPLDDKELNAVLKTLHKLINAVRGIPAKEVTRDKQRAKL